MRSEGFVRAGVTGMSVVSPAIDRCSSLSNQKDGAGAIGASESASWSKTPHTEICVHASRHSTFQCEDVRDGFFSKGKSSSLLLIPGPEVNKLSRKAGKVSRSSSCTNKRMRVTQMKDPVDEVKDNKFNKLGRSATKCIFLEKAEVAKQKNNFNGKRGDKRNSKVPKSEYDSFSLKPGSVSFSSATSGSNIFGINVLKSDVHDVTRHEDDELSLDSLLDGSYKCPSLGNAKGRKTANLDGNVLQSVRKASSRLQLPRPVRSENFPETDGTFSRKMSTCLLSSDPCIATSLDGDKGGPYHEDPPIRNKIDDSCSEPKPAESIDLPLYQPRDVLERLALPPPKDLESLLFETGKLTVSSRNTVVDPGSPNQTSYHTSLPPFPWSHASGGHCKTHSDAAKSSTSRSTCQVRWVRIGNTTTPVGGAAYSFAELESLTFDHNLVPSEGQKLGPLGNQNTQYVSKYEHGLSSSATCSAALQVLPASGGSQKHQENAVHSPRALGAARTLCDIAICPLKRKKPLQRAIKACSPKSIETPRETSTKPESVVVGHNDLFESANQMMTSKKHWLSTTEKTKDHGFSRTFIKGPLGWSTPRSSRSSPIKLLSESVVKRKQFNAIAKPSSTIPPSTRVLDMVGNGQQKLRKLVPVDWSRSRGKLD